MKKTTLFTGFFRILTLLLALTLLAGCGNAAADPTVPEPASEDAQQLQFFVEEAEPAQEYAPY